VAGTLAMFLVGGGILVHGHRRRSPCRPAAPSPSSIVEFVPGKGTIFYILGKQQGNPVGDDEFFAMVLKIWFGESPADMQLRDALLGLE
jgi:hypothetical protein